MIHFTTSTPSFINAIHLIGEPARLLNSRLPTFDPRAPPFTPAASQPDSLLVPMGSTPSCSFVLAIRMIMSYTLGRRWATRASLLLWAWCLYACCLEVSHPVQPVQLSQLVVQHLQRLQTIRETSSCDLPKSESSVLT